MSTGNSAPFPSTWRGFLRRLALEVVMCSLVGMTVFAVWTVPFFGLGYFSHFAFGNLARLGAEIGATLGIVRAAKPLTVAKTVMVTIAIMAAFMLGHIAILYWRNGVLLALDNQSISPGAIFTLHHLVSSILTGLFASIGVSRLARTIHIKYYLDTNPPFGEQCASTDISLG